MNAKVLLLVASAFISVGLAISFALEQTTGNPNFHVKVEGDLFDLDLSVQDGVMNYVATMVQTNGAPVSYSYAGAENKLFIGINDVNFDCYDISQALSEVGVSELQQVENPEPGVFVWPSPFDPTAVMRITVQDEPETVLLEIDGEEFKTSYFSRETSTVVNTMSVGGFCEVITDDSLGRRHLKASAEGDSRFLKLQTPLHRQIIGKTRKLWSAVWDAWDCVSGGIDGVLRCYTGDNNKDFDNARTWQSTLSTDEAAYMQMSTCIYAEVKKGDYWVKFHNFPGFERATTDGGFRWPMYRDDVQGACDFDYYKSNCDVDNLLNSCGSGANDNFRGTTGETSQDFWTGNDAVAMKLWGGKRVLVFRGSDDGKDWINNFNAGNIPAWSSARDPESDMWGYARDYVFNRSGFWLSTAKLVVNYALRSIAGDDSFQLLLDGSGFSSEAASVENLWPKDIASGIPFGGAKEFDVCVGHSLGGALAIEAAANGYCKSVVTFGAPLNPREDEAVDHVNDAGGEIKQFQQVRPVAVDDGSTCREWDTRTEYVKVCRTRYWWGGCKSWGTKVNTVRAGCRRTERFFKFTSYTKDLVPELGARGNGVSLETDLKLVLGGSYSNLIHGHILLGRRDRCIGKPFSFTESATAALENHLIESYGASDLVIYHNKASTLPAGGDAAEGDAAPRSILCEPKSNAGSTNRCYNYANADGGW